MLLKYIWWPCTLTDTSVNEGLDPSWFSISSVNEGLDPSWFSMYVVFPMFISTLKLIMTACWTSAHNFATVSNSKGGQRILLNVTCNGCATLVQHKCHLTRACQWWIWFHFKLLALDKVLLTVFHVFEKRIDNLDIRLCIELTHSVQNILSHEKRYISKGHEKPRIWGVFKLKYFLCQT